MLVVEFHSADVSAAFADKVSVKVVEIVGASVSYVDHSAVVYLVKGLAVFKQGAVREYHTVTSGLVRIEEVRVAFVENISAGACCIGAGQHGVYLGYGGAGLGDRLHYGSGNYPVDGVDVINAAQPCGGSVLGDHRHDGVRAERKAGAAVVRRLKIERELVAEHRNGVHAVQHLGGGIGVPGVVGGGSALVVAVRILGGCRH